MNLNLMLLLSAVVTVIAGFITGYSVPSQSFEAKPHGDTYLENRINELRSYLVVQEKTAEINKRSGGLLTIGQYIVGGLLATSFIQENMTNTIVGSLGLVVLVSSIIHQKFRPDLKSAAAKSRSLKLKQLLRRAQDLSNEIKLEYGDDMTPRLKSESILAASIGKQMEQIENDEIQDSFKTDFIQYNES